MGLLIEQVNSIRQYFLIRIHIVVFFFILSLIIPILSGCGSGGNAPSGGNDIEEVEGIILVEMVAAQTGVNFETVETEDFIATVYIGEQIYDDSNDSGNIDINFGVGIAPLMSYLQEIENSDEE